MKGLWDAALRTEQDAKNYVMAHSKLVLLIDPVLFVHIQDASTATDVWNKFPFKFPYALYAVY